MALPQPVAGRWVAAVPTWPTIFVAATSLIRIGLDTAGQPSTGAAGAGAGGGNLAAGLGWAGLGCLAQGYRCAPSSRAAAQPHNHQKVKESTLVKKQLAGRGGAGRVVRHLSALARLRWCWPAVSSLSRPQPRPGASPLRPLLCRAANVGSRRFHNH